MHYRITVGPKQNVEWSENGHMDCNISKCSTIHLRGKNTSYSYSLRDILLGKSTSKEGFRSISNPLIFEQENSVLLYILRK